MADAISGAYGFLRIDQKPAIERIYCESKDTVRLGEVHHSVRPLTAGMNTCMKYIPLLLASVVPFSLHAGDQAAFRDKVEFDAAGDRVVVRTAHWPSSARGMVEVEQRLQVNQEGNLRYDYEGQNESTKAYHRFYCAGFDMDPFDGEVSFTPEASGWHCMKEDLHPDDEHAAKRNEQSGGQDRSVDYLTARAPSGSVRAGVNFPATGTLTYQSSQAGALRGSVHVDHRCRFDVTKHYPRPFSGNQVAGVTCIAHDSRFLTTGIEGCIPRVCGSDRGTISVR